MCVYISVYIYTHTRGRAMAHAMPQKVHCLAWSGCCVPLMHWGGEWHSILREEKLRCPLLACYDPQELLLMHVLLDADWTKSRETVQMMTGRSPSTDPEDRVALRHTGVCKARAERAGWVSLTVRERKNINITILGDWPGTGWVARFVCVFFGGHSLWVRKSTEAKILRKCRTIPGKLCLCVVVFFIFRSQDKGPGGVGVERVSTRCHHRAGPSSTTDGEGVISGGGGSGGIILFL